MYVVVRLADIREGGAINLISETAKCIRHLVMRLAISNVHHCFQEIFNYRVREGVFVEKTCRLHSIQQQSQEIR